MPRCPDCPNCRWPPPTIKPKGQAREVTIKLPTGPKEKGLPVEDTWAKPSYQPHRSTRREGRLISCNKACPLTIAWLAFVAISIQYRVEEENSSRGMMPIDLFILDTSSNSTLLPRFRTPWVLLLPTPYPTSSAILSGEYFHSLGPDRKETAPNRSQ